MITFLASKYISKSKNCAFVPNDGKGRTSNYGLYFIIFTFPRLVVAVGNNTALTVLTNHETIPANIAVPRSVFENNCTKLQLSSTDEKMRGPSDYIVPV